MERLGSFLRSVAGRAGSGLVWDVGEHRVVEERPLSEGGFAFVVLVRDVVTGKAFALKKIICQEKEALETARREAEVLESLPSHKNIVGYFGHAVLGPGVNGCPHRQVLLLLELCSGGTLLDHIDRYGGVLPEDELLRAVTDIAEAVFCLHSHAPALQHRDLKLENVLQGSDGFWKVVDFGSWSDKTFDLSEVPVKDISKLQEEVTRNTTFMYRPPEMVDLYLRYPVTCAVDIWMIGCILFAMLYRQHPFQDAATLAIREARYRLPERSPPPSPKVVDLLVWLLAPDPRHRPTARNLVRVLWQWQDLPAVELPAPVMEHRDRLFASWDRGKAPAGRSVLGTPQQREGGGSAAAATPAANAPQRRAPGLGKSSGAAVAAAAAVKDAVAAADAAAAAATPWTASFGDFGMAAAAPGRSPASSEDSCFGGFQCGSAGDPQHPVPGSEAACVPTAFTPPARVSAVAEPALNAEVSGDGSPTTAAELTEATPEVVATAAAVSPSTAESASTSDAAAFFVDAAIAAAVPATAECPVSTEAVVEVPVIVAAATSAGVTPVSEAPAALEALAATDAPPTANALVTIDAATAVAERLVAVALPAAVEELASTTAEEATVVEVDEGVRGSVDEAG